MATTIVSVRKDAPERRSEPMSRKLMVSCPLAKDGSMVGRGATVLMMKFGAGVGASVCIGPGGMDAGEDESTTSGERGEPVGVQGMGWKGVGVGEEFGADVTIAKGSEEEAGAILPHPASKSAVKMILRCANFMAM